MEVRLNSTLRDRFGDRSFLIEISNVTTVREILVVLAEIAPDVVAYLIDDQGNVNDNVIIFCNGRKLVFLNGLDTEVGPHDRLDIFPKTGVQRALDYD